jgi:hypothetical protein
MNNINNKVDSTFQLESVKLGMNYIFNVLCANLNIDIDKLIDKTLSDDPYCMYDVNINLFILLSKLQEAFNQDDKTLAGELEDSKWLKWDTNLNRLPESNSGDLDEKYR